MMIGECWLFDRRIESSGKMWRASYLLLNDFQPEQAGKARDAIAIASENLETFENVQAEKFESLSDNLLWDRDTLCTAS